MSDSGGRPQSVSDEEIVRYFRESDEVVLTTSEVADAVDVSRRTALRRLSRLVEAETLGRKDVGDRSAVWWLPENRAEVNAGPADGPFVTAETFSSGQSDVSESVGEKLAAATSDERDA